MLQSSTICDDCQWCGTSVEYRQQQGFKIKLRLEFIHYLDNRINNIIRENPKGPFGMGGSVMPLEFTATLRPVGQRMNCLLVFAYTMKNTAIKIFLTLGF